MLAVVFEMRLYSTICTIYIHIMLHVHVAVVFGMIIIIAVNFGEHFPLCNNLS